MGRRASRMVDGRGTRSYSYKRASIASIAPI